MPDTEMCDQKECERAYECYRYRAVPDEHWQPYGYYPQQGCTAFMPIGDWPVRTMEEIERSRR